MLKRLFTPGRTQAFDKEIPAGWDNNWVAFEWSNFGLPMEPGVYAVTVVTDGNVQLQSTLSVNLYKDNSYNWVEFTEGVAVRLRWESLGELRFRCSSAEGGFVTVLVTPITNSLSLSLVESAAAWLRRWQHGAKTNYPNTGNRFGYGLDSEEIRKHRVSPLLGVLWQIHSTPRRICPGRVPFHRVPVRGNRHETRRLGINHNRRLHRYGVRHRELSTLLTPAGGGR